MDGLNTELKRAKELLEVYESIPTGGFGATMIKQTIKDAESCMQLGDTVGMLDVYQRLQNLE
jgi:hypothetical protein